MKRDSLLLPRNRSLPPATSTEQTGAAREHVASTRRKVSLRVIGVLRRVRGDFLADDDRRLFLVCGNAKASV